jgi:hypothetical protein
MTAPAAPVPGFYADPLDPAGERWWDGATWTEGVRQLERADAPAAAPADDPLVPAATDGPATPPTTPTTPTAPAQEPAAPSVPAGLYPDPYGEAPLRWWDGRQWTVSTSGAGMPGAIPVPRGPGFGLPVGQGAGRGWSSPPRRSRWTIPIRILLIVVALAVVLVLVSIAAAVFLVAGDHSTGANPAAMAAAVNLRSSDLPAGWTVEKADDTSSTGASADDTTENANFARCLGAADPVSATVGDTPSATFTQSGTEVESDVTVLRSTALVRQDLRAGQSPKLAGCFGQVETPGIRSSLAKKNVTLTGLSISRLPGASADGFAFRARMTVSANQQTQTVWIDSYVFVRGRGEVTLTVTRTGAAPDPALAASLLRRLRARATASIPAT